MWLFTEIGFFSVVQKPEDVAAGTLTIRSRSREDLEALGKTHLKFTSPISESSNTDYRFRAKAKHADVAAAMTKLVGDIGYSNFKSQVAKTQGYQRASLYEKVWTALLPLQKIARPAAKPPVTPQKPAISAGKISAGGVLVDGDGRVLLREPKGHFGGYVWTFAKGKVEAGQSIEEAALREVKEETGYDAEIIGSIPGEFKGDTGSTVFFLMRPKGEAGAHDGETSQIRWVTPAQARKLIAMTKSENGRKRDLAVLAAAQELIDHLSS